MIARLWWKESRQFGPIWVLLVLVALATQWLVLSNLHEEARGGQLLVLAVAWTVLYAIAVGSAAFAGEREAGTLTLLDALPVGRRLLWRGKASFALVSTLALGLLLAALAGLSTTHWKPEGFGWITLPLGAAALIGMAVAWGLFWSALSVSALLAAVLSVVCTVLALKLVLDLVSGQATQWFDELQMQAFGRSTPWLIGVAAVTATVSARVMARRPRRSGANRLWRNSVQAAERWAKWVRWSEEEHESEAEREVAPVHVARRGQPLLPELRVLSWQAVREFWPMWRLFAAVGLGVPLVSLFVAHGIDWWTPAGLAGLAGLMMGVQVFHLENRSLTQRFLAHQGARPGLVWLVKLAWGSVGLLIIWLGLTASLIFIPPLVALPELNPVALSVLLLVLATFPCGLLCGMVIRRGISASVVAVVATFLLALPLSVLASLWMLPWPGLALGLAAPVVITWAWRRDWLFERPAPGRWWRLGLLVAGVFAVGLPGFIVYRLWGVPTSQPIPAPAGWGSEVPPAENALPLYTEALRRLRQRTPMGAGPLSASHFGEQKGTVDKETVRQELAGPVAAMRAASLLPRSVAPSPVIAPLFPEQNGAELVWQAASYVSLEARDRLIRGDLDTAWDDVLALLRMSRQAAVLAPAQRLLNALTIERTALGLAMEWSAAPGQTPNRVREALQDLDALPPIPSLAESVKAEAQQFERTLTLPSEQLFDVLVHTHGSLPLFRLISWPWEIVRTRNFGRLTFANALGQAEMMPWRRDYIQHATRKPSGWIVSGGEPGMVTSDSVPPATILGPLGDDSELTMLPSFQRDSDLQWAYRTTPLAQLLLPNFFALFFWDDMNEVGRRATLIYLALRVYQLENGGRLPENLATFHSPDLPELPLDPFRRRLFGYTVAQPGSVYAPAGVVMESIGRVLQVEPMVGRRLLYSIGPDRVDHGGVKLSGSDYNDIVFPLPPEEVAESSVDVNE
jgi:hypothetical protein